MKPAWLQQSSWRFYFALAGPFLCALIACVRAVETASEPQRQDPYIWLMLLSIVVGRAVFDLGVCARYADQNQTALNDRIREQEKRIRELEARVAALTPPNSTG